MKRLGLFLLAACTTAATKPPSREKGLGWTERELHWALLRSRKQNEALRCNEPDPENNVSLLKANNQRAVTSALLRPTKIVGRSS